MTVVKCDKGHYYDESKYEKCPHCENGLKHINKELYIDDLSNEETRPLPEKGNDENKTVSLEIGIPLTESDGKTIGIYSFNRGTKLVTGWLVCTKGQSRGRDYKLYHGWNKIGRSIEMDIYVADDKSVSADNQASIVFDDKSNKFYIVNQQGSLTYLNNESLMGTMELKDGDCISMGSTEFVFVAFCKEERGWKEK